jgi:HEAT repeat protein
MDSADYGALIDTLLDGLDHGNARIRHDCAHALDHFGAERCLEPLRRLLDDPVPRVRRMALHVLTCDTCKLVPFDVDEGLLDEIIVRATKDPSINVRRHAAVALGAFTGNARAQSELRRLAENETDPATRRNARWALGKAGNAVRLK